MPNWTYEVTEHASATDLQQRLNDLSGRGFVLHSITPRRNSFVVVVKRAVDTPADRLDDDPLDWLRSQEAQSDAVVISLAAERTP